MSQQAAWEQEYTNGKGVPTSTRAKPSSATVRLLDYIHDNGITAGKQALDIGCGAGRNSIYLAHNGFNVTSIDFAQPALDRLKSEAESLGIADNLHIKKVDLTQPLPFEDRTFDLAIDIVSTISLNPEEMVGFERELMRIMKPGSLYLTYVHSRDDGYLNAVAPGKSSYTIDGLTDHTWTEEELRNLYKSWSVLKLEKTEKTDDFFGKQYTRRIWWLLLQKSS